MSISLLSRIGSCMPFMTHHYAFTMKVLAKQEPESSIEAARDPRWMEALGLRPSNTTSLRHMLEGEEPILPRKGRRKPKPDGDKDVERLTLELKGAC